MTASEWERTDLGLGGYLPVVEAALADLDARDTVGCLWRRDHTVWSPDPREIADRLGWLTITDAMRGEVPALRAFAGEVRDVGYRHVVLLGMGGSSLGPEVLRRTYGAAAGYLELIVLDSTVPARVRATTEAIDPARTLFLVSSKSGSTVEPLAFYRHFRGLVEEAVGREEAGEHFVAITDPGTTLEAMARERGFRRVFLNPPDIGGRYSVLSSFGLVPAALLGIDLDTLLDRADEMREACRPGGASGENPGAWLGAVMGTLAGLGRDKLTLVTSPSIGAFGLWAEQLLAESTGKSGRGIVPVDGEPPADPSEYGDDRLFVYLRLNSDDNTASDAAMDGVAALGHPVVRLRLRDRLDLGAELFRWEFATAIAGAVLGVNPFDQPDVQAAKDETDRVLREYAGAGRLPDVAGAGSVEELLAGASAGAYVAILAYVRETPEADRALAGLRCRIMERHRLPTTSGYGPRYLHSTGQLHKGGPDTGLFIQITAANEADLAVPGEPYTFGVLAAAQAAGDLRALLASGRRAVAVRLGPGGMDALGEMAV